MDTQEDGLTRKLLFNIKGRLLISLPSGYFISTSNGYYSILPQLAVRDRLLGYYKIRRCHYLTRFVEQEQGEFKKHNKEVVFDS